jgi:dTDP-4-amino-4,6-dideoxygalactose transaminase
MTDPHDEPVATGGSARPSRRVRLLDLGLRSGRYREEAEAAIARVLDSERFILGPEVEAFETELAAALGTGVGVVGVSNGSDALVLALLALGVGPGDEVIVPAQTFAATATSVALLGARPIFVDVVEPTLELDREAVVGRLTERTRAIIPVHLFGRAVDWPALEEALARAGRAGVALVEDAAQALGALVDGRRAGTLGAAACFSFFPSKNLGAFGDAGAVATADPALLLRLRRLRNQGRHGRDDHAVLGMNARLDALQAAILRARLPHLDGWVAARRAHATFYRQSFAELDAAGELVLPPADDPGGRFVHTYHQLVVRVPHGRRDALRLHLEREGIESAVYYPLPVPLQPCFAGLGHRPGEFPVAERASAEGLALPVHPLLASEDLEVVASAVRRFFGRAG